MPVFRDITVLAVGPARDAVVQRLGGGDSVAMVALDGCIFDEEQLALSHGYESLDSVAREAFVNHLHWSGEERVLAADSKIRSWIAEMRECWPNRAFRIYRQVEDDEVTIRFHAVRPDSPNWCEAGVEIIPVNG